MDTARAGDYCLLLVPRLDPAPEIRAFLAGLQESYGGTVTSPLHLTAQRLRVSPGGVLDAIIRLLAARAAAIHAFPVAAIGVFAIRSEFRGATILKATAPLNPRTVDAIASLNAALVRAGCEIAFPAQPRAWITLLEGLRDGRDRAGRSGVHNFPEPRHLFTAERLLVSRIDGPGRYTILAEGDLR